VNSLHKDDLNPSAERFHRQSISRNTTHQSYSLHTTVTSATLKGWSKSRESKQTQDWNEYESEHNYSTI